MQGCCPQLIIAHRYSPPAAHSCARQLPRRHRRTPTLSFLFVRARALSSPLRDCPCVIKPRPHRGVAILPGFRMLCGSRAALMDRITFKAPGRGREGGRERASVRWCAQGHACACTCCRHDMHARKHVREIHAYVHAHVHVHVHA